MKVLVTQTLERTFEVEVDAENDQEAIEAALRVTEQVGVTEWLYTWEPIAERTAVIG
ncbi:hypothetical protein [Pseudomonas syringae group genomosp. 3]|uniref:hypothetical protein n=1 Tax=Pseudomonas syringae group genomosp. 3 TaxID=251701 RepID=UPI0006CC9F65|nr:hypothetical protein [Pseudomonas syringae group genomosp. 3]KPB82031.1 Unknown protein sequence [Pseudomonas syringae pv. maculicola]